MAKHLKYGLEARKKMFDGILKVYEATRVTLGPKGKNVIIEQPFGYPHIVNDGATISKAIELEDRYENLGAQILIEAAEKTNDLVGDGTTTSIILAANLIKHGLDYLDKGVNPVIIRKGLEHFLPIITNLIKSASVDVESLDDLAEIAILSSGDQTIGQFIKEAYHQIGTDGIITLEEGKGNYSTLEVMKGYVYEKGFVSSYMSTDTEKQIASLDNALVLITNKKINSIQEVIPFLEVSIKKMVPLLIICDDIDQDTLGNIILNKLRGTFNCVITKSPFFGERRQQLLKDIAYITKSVIIDSEAGMTFNIEPSAVLGNIKKALLTKDQTTLITDQSDNHLDDPYLIALKHKLLITTSSYEKEWLEKRLARLSGGIALIKVGANSESQLRELYLRYEDALNACIAAKTDGVIEGAGKVLYEISERLTCDEPLYQTAFEMIKICLQQPFYQIVENAGLKYDEIIESINEVKLPRINWLDANTNQLVNLKKQGIIDPTKVAITCVTTSIGLASLFLTTACAIIDNDTKKEKNIDDSF